MTQRFGDMVQETIAAPGTATFALGTPSTGFVAFSTIPSITGGDTVDYLAIDASGTPWEVGTGTWTSGALARTTVLHNSSGGTTAVNFTGSTLVSNTLTAERYLAGPGGALTGTSLSITTTATGTFTGEKDWNVISVTNTSSETGGSGLNNACYLNHNFSTGTGGYQGLYVVNNQVGTTANLLDTGYYTAATFLTQNAYNDNGTSGAHSGHYYGFNAVARMLSGATFIDQIVGGEIDIAAKTGSSFNDLIGLQIVNQSGSSAPSGRFSTYFGASSGGADGTDTLQYGMSFGLYQGYNPVSSTGTLIVWYPHAGTGSAGTVANGVDFSQGTFTNAAWLSPGAKIDPSGHVFTDLIAANTAISSLTLQATQTGSVTVGSTTRGIDWAWGTGGNTAIANRGNDYGSASGGGFVLRGVSGTDTTIQQILQAGGTGFNAFQFWDGANKSLLGLNSVTGSVNSLTVSPAVTGSAPAITASGSDTNVSLNVATKGTGTLQINGVSQSAYSASPLFGTGADGTVTISSGTTVLSRDMNYANLTINGTGALNTNGYRVAVINNLDVSAAQSGAIYNSGHAAAASSGATPGARGFNVQLAITVPGPVYGSESGASGATGVGAAGGANAVTYFGNGGAGGAGAVGGASTNAGGAGGTNNGFAGVVGITSQLFAWPTPLLLSQANTGGLLINSGLCGSGGGAGGGDGSNLSGAGGSGGMGSPTVQIAARFIQRGTNTNTGIIQAKGGAGGAGGNATGGNSAGGGGGGGGGGGFVYIVTEALLGSVIPNAIDVSSGAGGSGGNGLGTGKGGNGGAGGNSGNVQMITLSASSGVTTGIANGSTVSGYLFGSTTFNGAGTAGSTTSTATGAAGGAGATMKVGL